MTQQKKVLGRGLGALIAAKETPPATPGLMVLSLQQKGAANKSRKKKIKVKETDLVLCTRQLSTMVEAGISLVALVDDTRTTVGVVGLPFIGRLSH